MSRSEVRIGVTTIRHRTGLVFAHNLQFEFEDAFVRATGARLIEIPPPPRPTMARRALRTLSIDQKIRLDPIERGLDLLFVPCLWPQHVMLDHIHRWRENCSTVVYYLFDSWPTERTLALSHKCFVDDVDLIAVSFEEAVQAFRSSFTQPVVWIPQAVDSGRFQTRSAERGVFCAAIGRQDEAFLAATRAYCRRRDRLLIYSAEHGSYRRGWEDAHDLHVNLLRHSRFALHRSNRDIPKWSERYAIDPPTARWFQSAAAGNVMVGTPPASASFDRLLPEASVVDVREFDSDARAVFEWLERQSPEEMAERTRRLADWVLLRHTWFNRVFDILRHVGMEDAVDPLRARIPMNAVPC
jgi:hypothetical protein